MTTKTPRPQNAHLRPNPGTLGVTPLAPDEASERVRIRTTQAALAAFEKLSAAERGHIVAAWYASQPRA